MATKSFVGRIERDDRFSAHSVTYDGYPGGVGASLARVLATEWAGGSPSRVLAELALFRRWWQIGVGLDGPSRVGCPNQRPGEQEWPLVTGRLGRALAHRSDEQWGYLFRGEEQLLVVKVGPWWDTPARAVRQCAVLDVAVIGKVDWLTLNRTVG